MTQGPRARDRERCSESVRMGSSDPEPPAPVPAPAGPGVQGLRNRPSLQIEPLLQEVTRPLGRGCPLASCVVETEEGPRGLRALSHVSWARDPSQPGRLPGKPCSVRSPSPCLLRPTVHVPLRPPIAGSPRPVSALSWVSSQRDTLPVVFGNSPPRPTPPTAEGSGWQCARGLSRNGPGARLEGSRGRIRADRCQGQRGEGEAAPGRASRTGGGGGGGGGGAARRRARCRVLPATSASAFPVSKLGREWSPAPLSCPEGDVRSRSHSSWPGARLREVSPLPLRSWSAVRPSQTWGLFGLGWEKGIVRLVSGWASAQWDVLFL